MNGGLLAGKVGLIMGVANQRSFAWAIAVAAARHGARVAVTYQNERLAGRAAALGEHIPLAGAYPCDVGDDESIDRCFQQAGNELGAWTFSSTASLTLARRRPAGPLHRDQPRRLRPGP